MCSSDLQQVKKYDTICTMTMRIFDINFHLFLLFITFGYLMVKCNFHVLAAFVPICQEPDSDNHQQVVLVPFWALPMFVYCFMLINSTMLYPHFLPIFTTQGIFVRTKLRYVIHKRVYSLTFIQASIKVVVDPLTTNV